MRWVVAGGLVLLAGCSSGPTPLGGGEYMVTRDYEHFVSTAQNKAVREATEHCASLGQVMDPGAATPIQGYYAGFSLRYRCKSA
jgi:hypothetical protein